MRLDGKEEGKKRFRSRSRDRKASDASAAVDSRITDDLRYSRADALRHAWVGVIIGRCRLAATIAILGSVYCDEEVCAW